MMKKEKILSDLCKLMNKNNTKTNNDKKKMRTNGELEAKKTKTEEQTTKEKKKKTKDIHPGKASSGWCQGQAVGTSWKNMRKDKQIAIMSSSEIS